MHRTGRKLSANSKLIFYGASGLVAGAFVGATLGLVGSLVSGEVRAALAALGAMIAIAIGTVEAFGSRVPLIQLDRETPFRWLKPGAIQWAIRNGMSLGIGAGSRLGFWLWYVIPLGSFLSGDLVVGAVGFGLYGLTRTVGARGIAFLDMHFGVSTERLLRFSTQARRLTAMQLILMGASTLVVVGV